MKYRRSLISILSLMLLSCITYGQNTIQLGQQCNCNESGESPWNNPNGSTASQSSDDIMYEGGNVGIGLNNPTERLHVVGNFLVTGGTTPDYVFEHYFNGKSMLMPSYKLMSLDEVESFTRQNKHLPGVPSAAKIAEQGGILLNLQSEIQLEKIEELFLHSIEQNKRIQILENQIIEAQKKNKKLEARLLALEALLVKE